MEIKHNDYFRFRYHPSKEHGWNSNYHCFEGLLVAKVTNGTVILHDTYWNLNGRDGRSFTTEQAMAEGTLDFYCNIDDIETIEKHLVDYYDDADVFRLTSQKSCYVFYYKRKGAQFSASKMLATVESKIEDAQRQIKWAKNDLERYTEIKAKIEGGDTTVYI